MRRKRPPSSTNTGLRCSTIVVIVCLAAACGRQAPEDGVPLVPEGEPPLLLSEKPIDLVVFQPNETADRVTVSSERAADYDISGLFTPGSMPSENSAYWSAAAPVTLDIDLGRACYVTSVVVYPLSDLYGIGGYEVETVFDETTMKSVPAGRYVYRSSSHAPYDGLAEAAAVDFFPKHTGTIRLRFTGGSAANPEKIFVRKIRILGKPEESLGQSADSREETPVAQPEDPVNLASFAGDEIDKHVSVSEDRRPNGSFESPWVTGNSSHSYWCATSPAWVSIDLGRESLLNEIRLSPLSEKHGFESAYVKFVDDEGRERDPEFPPGSNGLVEEATGYTLSFGPETVRRVKIYLGAAPGEALVYLRNAEILGSADGDDTHTQESKDPENDEEP